VVAISFKVKFTLITFLTLFVVCLWGIRLTANWAYTFHGLKYQDWRYTMLNEKTKSFYPIINFVGIHLVPTLVVYLAIMPAVILILENPQLNLLSIVGVLVCLTAVSLQTVSDIEMHKYRKNKTTPFIRVGLWKYSRHPDYLGEILMWWGVAVFAVVNMPDKIWLITGAFVNTLLFSLVSIPMAEGKQSQKQGYEEYKHETRVLLPLPKK
jgi:steroid 5-alpha reductase family enzyme